MCVYCVTEQEKTTETDHADIMNETCSTVSMRTVAFGVSKYTDLFMYFLPLMQSKLRFNSDLFPFPKKVASFLTHNHTTGGPEPPNQFKKEKQKNHLWACGYAVCCGNALSGFLNFFFVVVHCCVIISINESLPSFHQGFIDVTFTIHSICEVKITTIDICFNL